MNIWQCSVTTRASCSGVINKSLRFKFAREYASERTSKLVEILHRIVAMKLVSPFLGHGVYKKVKVAHTRLPNVEFRS